MTAGVSKNGKPTSAGISFCEMPTCILHIVSISANTLRKNKQGFMYSRKPWQQGITLANQGRRLRSPSVMPSCYSFLLHKNHMVGITENVLPVCTGGRACCAFLKSKCLTCPMNQVFMSA